MEAQRETWQVVIEWNGSKKAPGEPSRKPSTRWYRYLRKLTGMGVRAQTGQTLAGAAQSLSERMTKYGVVFQEGCIQCNSYSLARSLYLFAREGIEVEGDQGQAEWVKPDAVTLVRVEEQEVDATEDDLIALQRMKNAFGHIGRWPGKPVVWTICCYEELATYEKEGYEIANCPVCGGTHIRKRPGEAHHFADPGGDIWDAWLRTRFAGGQFEIPQPGPDLPPAQVDIRHDEERAFVEKLAVAPVLQQIAHLERDAQLAVLDAVLVARLRWRDERRSRARIEGVTEFFVLSDGAVDMVSLAEHPSRFDLMDAAGPLGAKQTAFLLLRYLQQRAQAQATSVATNGNLQAVPA